MSPTLEFNKNDVSKLRSYLAAILDWKEKEFYFLPCIDGYLVSNPQRKSLLWIHKFTVEATLNVIYNMTKETIEELLFSLMIGGSIIKELVKSKYPNPPKQTILFFSGLYSIEYGNIIITDPEGKLGTTLEFLDKTMTSISSLVSSTSENITKMIKKQKTEETKKKVSKENKEKNEDNDSKPVVYIQIIDNLYYHLSKERKFKEILPPSSGGYEFRTVYINEAAKFLKLIQDKGKFTIKYQGDKKILF